MNVIVVSSVLAIQSFVYLLLLIACYAYNVYIYAHKRKAWSVASVHCTKNGIVLLTCCSNGLRMVVLCQPTYAATPTMLSKNAALRCQSAYRKNQASHTSNTIMLRYITLVFACMNFVHHSNTARSGSYCILLTISFNLSINCDCTLGIIRYLILMSL